MVGLRSARVFRAFTELAGSFVVQVMVAELAVTPVEFTAEIVGATFTVVKVKLAEMKSSMPEGVEVVSTYDRSELIQRSITSLKDDLIMEMIIVSFVILFFLWHIPSAIVPIITIPISVALAFIPMYFMGLTSNIMSLAGIAISIGVLVDGAIVEVENAYKKLERWQEEGRQ